MIDRACLHFLLRICQHVINWCFAVIAVPAAILDHLSSDDVNVQEGETVVLICNVTGVPTPDVTWYRRPATSTKSSDKQRELNRSPHNLLPGW